MSLAEFTALDDAVEALRLGGLGYGVRVEPVYLRVASVPDGIAIDLGTRNWTAAVVTAGSWVVRPQPVRFRRPPTLAPLPVPGARRRPHGPPRPSQCAPHEDNRRLVLGFLLGALRPQGPYAALGLSGQQGSAKSVSARLLKRLIDPTTDGNGLRSLTKNEAAFWTAASNSWLLVFDNVSGLTAERADLPLAVGDRRWQDRQAPLHGR